MNKSIGILFCVIILGCATQNPSLYNADSKKFKNRYKEFIGQNETEIASWYNYVKTKVNDNGSVICGGFGDSQSDIISTCYHAF